MARHHEVRSIDVPPQVIFDLVADVERYPEFLPMWHGAEVSHRTGAGYDTSQSVGVGWLCYRFRTHTLLEAPRRIIVTSDDDLFRALRLSWEFAPTSDGGCRIDFSLDFEIAVAALQPTLDLMMMSTARSMVTAFVDRAKAQAKARATAKTAETAAPIESVA